MKQSSIRSRISRCLGKERSRSTEALEFEVRTLRPEDHSTLILKELPQKQLKTPHRERIEELTEEIQMLYREKQYHEARKDLLLQILPILHYHTHGQFSVIQECLSSVEALVQQE